MHKDDRTIRLRLPGLMVLGIKEWEDSIEVVARHGNEEPACPRWGRMSWHVHQWRQQSQPSRSEAGGTTNSPSE